MTGKNIEHLIQVIDYGDYLQRDNLYTFRDKQLIKSIPLDIGIQVQSGDYLQIEMPDPIISTYYWKNNRNTSRTRGNISSTSRNSS